VVDEPQVEARAFGQAQPAERGEVRGVGALAWHRQVDEVERPPDGGDDGAGELGEHARVGRHHQVLIGRAAVAEVIAELDVGRHRGPQALEQGEDPRLVVGGTGREVVLEHQHLLADVPLDAELGVGDGGGDLVERPEQRPLVHPQVVVVRARAHVHAGARHGGGQADLEA